MPDATFFPPLPEGELDLDKIKQWVQNNVDTFRRSIAMQGELFSANWVDNTTGWKLFADGSAEFNGHVNLVGAGASLSVGAETLAGVASQVHIHSVLEHIALLEKDDADYPDDALIIDINGKVGRIFWYAPHPTAERYLELYSPSHATQAHDIILYDSNDDVIYQWDESAADHIYSVGGGEVARITGTTGHNLQGLAWTTWTPALTGAVSNPNLGSTGTAEGRYVRIGNLVFAQFECVFNGTGISAGSGQWFVSTPVAAASTSTQSLNAQMGSGFRFGSSTVSAWGVLEFETTTTLQVVGFQSTAAGSFATAGGLTSANAGTLAANSFLRGDFWYEAA
jgi:hypothetical protein